MKSLIFSALVVLTANLTHAEEAKVWAEQALCNIDFSYHDLNAADIGASQKVKKSVLIELERNENISGSYKRVTVEVPELQSTVDFAPLFQNYEYDGKPASTKSLAVSYELVIDGHSYGSTMTKGKANANELLVMSQYSLRTAESIEIQKYYDTVGKDKKMTVPEILKVLYPASKKFVVRHVTAICSAGQTRKKEVTPEF